MFETAVVEGIRACSFQRCQSCGFQAMKQKLVNRSLQYVRLRLLYNSASVSGVSWNIVC